MKLTHCGCCYKPLTEGRYLGMSHSWIMCNECKEKADQVVGHFLRIEDLKEVAEIH